MVGKVCAVSDVLASLLNAQLDVGLGKPILWREVIGNLFGLASVAPDSLEILMTTSQARQFVARCRVVVASGRQYCPYCSQQILSAEGHLCPRSNGYRKPLVW